MIIKNRFTGEKILEVEGADLREASASSVWLNS